MRDSDDFRGSDNLKKPNKNRKFTLAQKLLIASLLLITVAVAQHLIFDLAGVEARQDLRLTDTGISISYGFDMHADFYSPGANHFFYSTRDGIQNISSIGEQRWQHGFNKIQPKMVGRGGTVAVGEPNGHRIYVFGQNGHMYTAILEHPVMLYAVNGAGYLSVIARTDTGYDVLLFSPDSQGSPPFRSSINDANVIPMSADVSNCGTYVAIALLDINTRMFSRVTFSYVRLVDSRGVLDGLFRAYDFDGEFVYRVQFTSCGRRALVFTDQRILGYESGEGPQGPMWSISLYNQLDKLYIGENILAYVTGDAFLNEPNAVSPGILRIYNFDGNLTGSYDLGSRATHLSIGFNTVLAGTGRRFYAIDRQGTLLWEYSAIMDVNNMIFLDNTDTVLLAGGTRAAVMRRLRGVQ